MGSPERYSSGGRCLMTQPSYPAMQSSMATLGKRRIRIFLQNRPTKQNAQSSAKAKAGRFAEAARLAADGVVWCVVFTGQCQWF